ncbi:MAG: energy-coupling factor ABC transporter permease [Lachnospiraceae bacterium]|nr:energy-coupling factor ABC transporter permease [Lachnospiraceae bacterium]
MHMADALVVPAVAGVMSVCSLGVAGYSVRQVQREEDDGKIPVMGVMGAFVFAAQMINFTIPGTGSSGHLCGGMLLTALLGPCRGFLTMIGVLLIQCLIFADGGLMALGCNVWNMAFYGCFIGAWIWKLIMRSGMSKRKITVASILGCVLTLQLGALSVVLETSFSGITALPFAAFLAWMQPIHLAIGAVEGLITSAVLLFIYQSRPELFWGVGESKPTVKGKWYSRTIPVLLLLTVLIGGALSLFASVKPDGLEWSIQKITGSTSLPGGETVAGAIQERLALLPDYGFRRSDLAVGTGVSGIVGAGLVLGFCIGMAWIFKFLKQQTQEKQKEKSYE